MKHLPNLISIARILLVAPTLYFLWHHNYSLGLLLFLIAGASDGVDGFLARRFHWQTRLGTYLDPIGDKALLVGCYLALGLLGHLPSWLVALVIGRDIIIVIGATLYHYAVKDAAMQPLWSSKINTVCQIALVLVILYQLAKLPLAQYLSPAMIQGLQLLVMATTLFSGGAYIMGWWVRIVQSLRARSRT